jgi:teichuronic acid biosynthesis glycosyltransferase TuaC
VSDRFDVVWLTSEYPWAESPILGVFHGTSTRALVRRGLGVTVVAPTPFAPWPLTALNDRWRRYARAPETQRDAGVEIRRPRYVALPGEPAWAGHARMRASVAERVRRSAWPTARVIHAHFAAPIGIAARELSRRTGLPYVVTLHGDDVTGWPKRRPGELDAYRSALRDAAAVIAVSQALADEARELTGAEPVVVPIGIELERFTADIDRMAARRELGVADDEVLMLMVAYLDSRKRVRDLVDAIHAVGAPLRAVFAGAGPELGYRAQPGRIDYIGPRSNGDVPRLLAAADVTVLPSEREGLPTALVEAGAAGVPIIASRAGGTPELLAEDRGVLLDEISPGSIADALRGFLADRRAAADRAARLRAHVLEEYDVDGAAERLEAIYRQVASPVARGRSSLSKLARYTE